MTRWIVMLSAFSLGVVALAGVTTPAAAADVRVGINFGVPAPVFVAPPAPVYVAPPAPVYVAPPPVVVAPGVPVYYYGANYYTYYGNAWFVGPRFGGPWRHVAYGRVPRPIIVAPHSHLVSGHGHWSHGGHRH